MSAQLAMQHGTLGERLTDANVALSPGQVTAICGPNGAGKSTLLSALAGLEHLDSGQAMLEGRALADLPPKERARRIGYLPQSGEVAWDIAVRSVVALGRLPHGGAEDDVVNAAITELALDDLADRAISTVSGGERARALLARVFAGEPEWILADEPLAALDLAHQLSLLGSLKARAADGSGVVIVLHDLALAMNHADRVVVLDQGRIAADGVPADALSVDILRRVWNVDVRWLGQPGAQALVLA